MGKRVFFGLLLALVSINFAVGEDINSVLLAPGVRIQGEKEVSSRNPEKYGYAYYGIRYGTASRFEHSTENTDFAYFQNPTRLKLGPVCPQAPFFEIGVEASPRVLSMEEDCLYLDVIVPRVHDAPKRGLPVMVFIYGGALQMGDKDMYNGTFLALETEAIYVAVNYRVSAFGFLSTGDDKLPGNYGLGDCKTALEWVVKHIGKFNGDAARITVFGESAGAILTSALYMDPESRRYIRAAIALSGSSLMDIATKQDPRPLAEELAEKVNCSKECPYAMVQCLKTIPQSVLLNAARKMEHGNPDLFPYGFVVDNVHIKKLPRLELQEVKLDSRKSTFITGYLREDMSLLLVNTNPQIFDQAVPVTYAGIREMVAKQYLPTNDRCKTPQYDLAERVMKYYNISDIDDRGSMTLKFIHLASDSLFGYPALKESFAYAKQAQADGFGNQFYLISYDQQLPGFGAFHAMELGYIFGDPLNKILFNLSLNDTVQASLLSMMREIVHNGKMDGPDFGREGSHMELTQTGHWEKGSTDFKARFEFWEDVVNTPCSEIESGSANKRSEEL
ncbi:bile salt-activated lipase-like isoform X2 [Paramacrobiotus metropolitanus]|nr:bile salt-activated lipase-like isoform X2 [Paramacrobiotus metropolitanus]XP_055330207.1 bile salt-activated lipase-like isoform X2 [Paramacrobiotus metropolitanus]XP_055330208.1 bile salt-activated lipase-like isoform X2 [Paramacrobiotus metropolitanus]